MTCSSVVASMLAVTIITHALSVQVVMAADLCTAVGVESGMNTCLASDTSKDECCDYVINEIVVPCGQAEICGLELGAEVVDFLDYCRFKCHGLAYVSRAQYWKI